MRLLLLCGVASLVACDMNRPSAEQPPSRAEGLLATGLMPVTTAGPMGPAEEDQREPDVTTGPGGERLVVWVDQRNFRFRQSDIYGARVLDGGVLDPLGLRIASGPGADTFPSVAFDGTTYTVVWSVAFSGGLTMATRFTSPLAPSASWPVVAGGGYSARVAAGGGHTLVVYRESIGYPSGLLFDADGGPSLLGDGGTVVSFLQPPVGVSDRAMQATWSEAHQAFFVLIADRGLFLTKLDPSPADGGAPQVDPPVLLSATNFGGVLHGIELAAAPDGALAATWRTNGNLWALVLPQPPLADLDAGVLLSTTAIGSPSITWTGTRFRVVAPDPGGAVVSELFLDGGVSPLQTLNAFASEPTGCFQCPPFVLEGPTVISTAGATNNRFGADLFVRERPEDVGAPSVQRVTSSRPATHSPVVAWAPDAGSALLAWSSSDDAGLQLHDVWYSLYLPTSGALVPPTPLGAAGRDDAFPRVTWALDRWWLGTAGPSAPVLGSANVYSSADGVAFTSSFTLASNGPPDLESGWVAVSNADRVQFRQLLSDAGVGPATFTGPNTGAWFPELAVDALGRPVATSVTSTGAGVYAVAPNVSTLAALTNSAGASRQASIASDGVRFASVYTTAGAGFMTVERRDLEYLNDGGVAFVGSPVELARAGLIETPSIAYARGQYLVTWSERDDLVLRNRLRMRTLKTDGGAGAPVPLDLGVAGDDLGARLSVSPAQDLAFITWTRLDAPDAGVPTGYLARLPIGAPQGTTCSTASECTTGNCADLVCCDSACADGCGRCSAEGVCRPLPIGTTCQPAGECLVAASVCNNVSLVCPSATAPDGFGCSADAGRCQSGVCVLTTDAGTVDAGTVDAGTVDAGTVDAGTVDAGTVDAGTVDAGTVDAGTVDAGTVDAGTVDAGTVDAGAVDAGDGDAPGNLSHYSWSQGCGCGGTEAVNGVLVLGLLLLRRRRFALSPTLSPSGRGREVVRWAGLIILLALPAFAQTPKRLKLTFPGVSAGAGARGEDASAIAEFLQTQLVALDVYEVTGATDLAALLGKERQKQLLGCEAECAVDIAGALDADRLLNGSLSKVGDTWLLTLALYDARTNSPIFRTTRRVTGALDRALDAIDPMLAELTGRDAPAQAAAQAAKPTPGPAPTSTHQFTVGVRAELETLGLAAGQPALAPAVSASWGSGVWGATLTLIVMATPGVRAEGRVHLLESSRVRPLAALGVSVFGLAVAPRAALGVTADVGPVRFGLDAALEYFVSGQQRFAPLAVLVALGVAWRF